MQPKIQVVELTSDRFDDAVDCCTRAFGDSPIFEFFFPESEPRKADRLNAVFDFANRSRELTGDPMYCLLVDDKLVAVTHLSGTKEIEPNDAVGDLWMSHDSIMGSAVDARFEAYMDVKVRNRPESPHVYVVALAVSPEYQGKGYGGQLLQAVFDLSEADPLSESTALDTSTFSNLAFYEKRGFEITGEEDLQGTPVWILERKNRGTS